MNDLALRKKIYCVPFGIERDCPEIATKLLNNCFVFHMETNYSTQTIEYYVSSHDFEEIQLGSVIQKLNLKIYTENEETKFCFV